MSLRFYLLLIGFFLSLSSGFDRAWAITGPDYDGDGLTDFEVAYVRRPSASLNAGTTNCYTRNSSNAQLQTFTFSFPGDALVRFQQADGKYYPGIVWVESATKPLFWDVATANGGHNYFRFGYPGDIIPNQQPIYGQGTQTLPVVVRAQADGTLRWYVLLPNLAVGETVFGIVGDQVGMAPDGTLLALRNNFTWYGKKFFENQLAFIRQWGLPGDIPLIPVNDNQLVISRPTGAGQVAYVLNADNTSYTQALGPDNSIPTIGRFFGSSLDFGWHERSTGRVTALNSSNGGAVPFYFGNSLMAIATPSGQVFQPNSTGQYGSSGSATNPGLASRCSTVRSLTSGEIYKDIASTHISSSDPRSGSTSFITRSGTAAPSVSCIEAYDAYGNKVHQLGFYGSGGEYSSRFYGGSGCGDRKSGDSIAATAANTTGSSAIYLKINSTTCVTVPHAGACFNSSAC